MKKFIIIFTIVLFIFEPVYPSDVPKSNIYIIDSIFNLSFDLLHKKIEFYKIDTICLQFHNHNADFYLEKELLSKITKPIIFKSPCNFISNNVYTLNIIINSLLVDYNKIETNNDQFKRKVIISLSYSLIMPDKAMVSLPDFSSIYSDTISISDIKKIEFNQYDFAKGIIPDEEQSFFSKIIEPLAVVGSIIISLVLFFTVRSN